MRRLVKVRYTSGEVWEAEVDGPTDGAAIANVFRRAPWKDNPDQIQTVKVKLVEGRKDAA